MNAARPPVLIAVDIGNGSAKLGAFADWFSPVGRVGEPTCVARVATNELGVPPWAPELPPSPCLWCVASVHREGQQRLALWVSANRPDDEYRLLTHRDLPLAIGVDHPDRVGVDRLAAAVGANSLRHAGCPAVVVDSGTAMTIDLVSAGGEFLGGAILPGVGLSARALADQTDLLPLVDPAWRIEPPGAVGGSTAAAIRSGLFWGAVGAIRELSAQFARALPGETQPMQIFLTGGDAPLLAPQLGAEAVASPHLVLEGIVLAARTFRHV